MKKENIVLIIDQNPTRKNNISSRLRMMGYTTELTSSGFHAISLLEKSNNSKKFYKMIVILGESEDMPGREILLLMREVNESKKKLPILFVNPENDPDHILQVIREGANDYIVEIQNDGQIVSKVQKIAPLEK
ncbi:MAG: response regulator [Bacteriovoracaceae bacterium]|nr:response regulator [Bacteriovoracaceae bacterium]